MVNETLFTQSISLMAYGMSTVFIFLLSLIIAMKALSSVIEIFVEVPIKHCIDEPPVVSKKTLKILQAAVDEHRKNCS